MSEPIIINLTSAERFGEGESQKAMTEVLLNAGFYDVVEVSRKADISKISEMLKFLPDTSEIAYVVTILDKSDGSHRKWQERKLQSMTKSKLSHPWRAIPVHINGRIERPAQTSRELLYGGD